MKLKLEYDNETIEFEENRDSFLVVGLKKRDGKEDTVRVVYHGSGGDIGVMIINLLLSIYKDSQSETFIDVVWDTYNKLKEDRKNGKQNTNNG